MTFNYDGLTPQLLRRRFWLGSGTKSSCYDRLARLLEAGYLRAIPLPAETIRGGRGQRWLTLGPKAIPLLRELLQLSTAEIKRLRHSYIPQFFQHELLVRRIRLDIELACTQTGLVEITDWQHDKVLKREPIKVRHQPTATNVNLVSDSIFNLSLLGGPDHSFFLEADRATIRSPRHLIGRLKGYLIHTAETLMPVLVVVPDGRRAAQVYRWAELAAQQVEADPRLIWITTAEQLNDHAVLFGRIWQAVAGPKVALVPTTAASVPKLAETETSRLILPLQRPPYITRFARNHQTAPPEDDLRLQ